MTNSEMRIAILRQCNGEDVDLPKNRQQDLVTSRMLDDGLIRFMYDDDPTIYTITRYGLFMLESSVNQPLSLGTVASPVVPSALFLELADELKKHPLCADLKHDDIADAIREVVTRHIKPVYSVEWLNDDANGVPKTAIKVPGEVSPVCNGDGIIYFGRYYNS